MNNKINIEHLILCYIEKYGMIKVVDLIEIISKELYVPEQNIRTILSMLYKNKLITKIEKDDMIYYTLTKETYFNNRDLNIPSKEKY